MEKNKMLKVVSILFIIAGAFVALFSLIFLFGGSALADMVYEILVEMDASYQEIALAAIQTLLLIMGILYLIEAAAYLTAGIIGVKQKSAKVCFIVAIVAMAVCGALAIYNMIGGSGILSALISLVLPVLYLVGAIQYKKAWTEAEQQAAIDEGSQQM
ncbi:MAG: hypothetical protein NC350_03015 [Corallococcus sp.]|nr:hypothetical protein [Corallococcus sp.]